MGLVKIDWYKLVGLNFILEPYGYCLTTTALVGKLIVSYANYIQAPLDCLLPRQSFLVVFPGLVQCPLLNSLNGFNNVKLRLKMQRLVRKEAENYCLVYSLIHVVLSHHHHSTH